MPRAARATHAPQTEKVSGLHPSPPLGKLQQVERKHAPGIAQATCTISVCLHQLKENWPTRTFIFMKKNLSKPDTSRSKYLSGGVIPFEARRSRGQQAAQ